jgi:phosphopantothenoylcysteine decarboxylase/phosphopantothenate--cysteine ligase
MNKNTSFEVAFGISGSISAYKSLDVIRHLRKKKIHITPILSDSAHQFVTPWSVETLAESPLIQADVHSGKITHLDVIKSANLFIICPASANMIAKLSTGHCNDLLSASFLSFTGNRMVFPAMHTEMYENSITQSNLERLKQQGIIVVTPDEGALACGDTGRGRLPEPTIISQLIQAHLFKSLPLNGMAITITCGGTSEPIDPVRHIGNLGSGISGHVMANLAASYGAKVTLIRSKKHPILSSIHCIDVNTAADIRDAVLTQTCDALIMNAAVSDFTLTAQEKKQSRGCSLNLTLSPTEDILKAFNQKKPPHCKSIGFCLSDEDNLTGIAQNKRIQKGCDVMIANNSKNFGREHRSFHVITSRGTRSFKNLTLEETGIEILSTLVGA